MSLFPQTSVAWARSWYRTATGNPYLLDTALALTAATVSVRLLIASRQPDGSPWPWWMYLLAVATAAPLPWRRRAPVLCMVLVWAALGPYSHLAHAIQPQFQFAALIALYTAAAHTAPRTRAVIAAATVVIAVVGTRSLGGAFSSILTFGCALMLGSLVWTQRQLNEQLTRRAEQLEREQEAEAAKAAAEERTRIARDMHDILAHSVSLMVVQAEAGPVVVRSAPDRAERAFDSIAETGRETLFQLRALLGVLRDSSETAQTAPQPGLAALPELVEGVRRAGIDVRLDDCGRTAPLAAGVDSAAYRIIQEALTNVVKHSTARKVSVRLERAEDGLRLEIEDDGGDGRRPVGSASVVRSGRGLVGIRERAAACGGSAEAGPGPDGRGFRVAATLPLS
ncbi:sensor histidine kinase [Streptomyces sp. NPDC005820]|uniref:sensor histidine kinase n=1 Tax=Streptomyces sp. NPDC005820 TaxID=3157069 RepID=UPI0033C264CC